MVFTTRRHGRAANLLEAELDRLGTRQKNGKPNHPQTQGKVERFQQTLKKWLRAQPAQPADLAALQALLDQFTSLYNTARPHRSLPHRATPAAAYAARPKAVPGTPAAQPEQRVRTGRADTDGKISLDLNGKRHSIGTGREHARTRVLILVNGLHMRIINRDTGELVRELTIDPARNYQPTGKPRGRRKHPAP
jgi:Integrase core domain